MASVLRLARRRLLFKEGHHGKDVVCRMEIDLAKAAGTSEFNGKTYFFCSKSRKAKFDADPTQYAKSS